MKISLFISPLVLFFWALQVNSFLGYFTSNANIIIKIVALIQRTKSSLSSCNIPEVNHPIHEMKCQEHNWKDNSAVFVNVTSLKEERIRFFPHQKDWPSFQRAWSQEARETDRGRLRLEAAAPGPWPSHVATCLRRLHNTCGTWLRPSENYTIIRVRHAWKASILIYN